MRTNRRIQMHRDRCTDERGGVAGAILIQKTETVGVAILPASPSARAREKECSKRSRAEDIHRGHPDGKVTHDSEDRYSGEIPDWITTCHPKRSWLCRVAAGFIHALGGRDIAIRTRIAKPTATGNSRLASGHAPSHQFLIACSSVGRAILPMTAQDAGKVGPRIGRWFKSTHALTFSEESVQLRHSPQGRASWRLGCWCNRARRNNPPVTQLDRVLVF